MNHQENSNNVLIRLYMNQNHQSFRNLSLFSPDLITMTVHQETPGLTSRWMFYFENLTPTTALSSLL